MVEIRIQVSTGPNGTVRVTKNVLSDGNISEEIDSLGQIIDERVSDSLESLMDEIVNVAEENNIDVSIIDKRG